MRIHPQALSETVDTIVGPTGFGNVRAMTFGRGNALYAVDNAANLRRITLHSGLSTIVGPVGFGGIDSLAYDGTNDVLFGVDDQTDQLIRIDQATGFGTPVGTLGFEEVLSLAFDEGAGVLFGIDADTGELVRIDPQTGLATASGGFGSRSVIDLVIEPNTNALWAVSYHDGGQILEVNRTTGRGTLVSTALLGSSDYGAVAMNPETGILYWSDGEELMIIDSSTGHTTALGSGFPPWTPDGITGGVAFARDTNNLFATEVSRSRSFLLDVDPAKGTRTRIGRINLTGSEVSIAWDPVSRVLYAVQHSMFLTIDPSTGIHTPITTFPPIIATQSLAYDTSKGTLYGIDVITRALLTIHTATGATHLIGAAVGIGEIPALAFDPNSRTLYAVDTATPDLSARLMNIDPAATFSAVMGATGYLDIRGLEYLDVDCNENLIPDDCEGDIDNDGLLDACEPADCGDGVVSAGEQCDSGAANSDSTPDACRTNCLLAFCGDAVVDSGEECDLGAANSDAAPDGCRTDCRTAYCGDGVVDSHEECDGESDAQCPGLCSDDCRCFPTIPTISQWGLGVLALLLLILGKIRFARPAPSEP